MTQISVKQKYPRIMHTKHEPRTCESLTCFHAPGTPVCWHPCIYEIQCLMLCTHVSFFSVFLSSDSVACAFHLCFRFFSSCCQAAPEQISLVTLEAICVSVKNSSECKRPALWTRFAQCRWSRQTSSCSHVSFQTPVSLFTQGFPPSFAPRLLVLPVGDWSTDADSVRTAEPKKLSYSSLLEFPLLIGMCGR